MFTLFFCFFYCLEVIIIIVPKVREFKYLFFLYYFITKSIFLLLVYLSINGTIVQVKIIIAGDVISIIGNISFKTSTLFFIPIFKEFTGPNWMRTILTCSLKGNSSLSKFVTVVYLFLKINHTFILY